MDKRAFTLIELLVVVAIIAVLAGLLLPSLGSVKEAARSTRCAASQRQIGVAAMGYVEDWDGILPNLRQDSPDGVVYWSNILAPSLGLDHLSIGGASYVLSWKTRLVDSAIYGCPLMPRTSLVNVNSSYGWNTYPLKPDSNATSDLFTTPTPFGNAQRQLGLSQITKRSNRVLLGDSVKWHLTKGSGPDYFPINSSSGAGDPTRHRGRSNHVMYDGRTVSLDLDQLIAAVGDPGTLP